MSVLTRSQHHNLLAANGSSLAAVLNEGLRQGAGVVTHVSDAAQIFFEGRGYVAQSRNSVPLDDQWLMNTTMTKKLAEN